MKQALVITLLLTLTVGSLTAQQRNLAGVASMQVNGANTSPGPINVQVPRGSAASLFIEGGANQPFGVFYAPAGMRSNGFFMTALGPQFIDLDDSQPLVDLFAGFDPTLFVTDNSGQWNTSFTPSPTSTIGSNLSIQGFVANPAASWPVPISLTAASEVSVIAGVTTVPLSLANNGNFRAVFATYGLPDFPFYENTYNAVYINADGNLTFTSGDGDFTPTPSEFHSGRPRIAPFWTDIDPTFGGSITATFSPNGTFGPQTSIAWDNLPVWQNRGGRHTYGATIYHLTGDIQFDQSLFNLQPIYDCFMGIGPGNNILPPGTSPWPAQTDFSSHTLANPKLTAPRESLWEWYGLVGMTYYTPTFNNGFDLTGQQINFTAISAGSAGAMYNMWTQ